MAITEEANKGSVTEIPKIISVDDHLLNLHIVANMASQQV